MKGNSSDGAVWIAGRGGKKLHFHEGRTMQGNKPVDALGPDSTGVTTAEGGARVLALDLGTERIGLALSDPLGLTAQPLPTMQRRNKREDLNFLRSLVRRHGVTRVVLGNPVNMDGTEGPQSAKAREFGVELQKRLGIEVELWDERLTTVEAQRVLRATGTDPVRRKEAVDQTAAVLLLQNFLEAQRTSLGGEHEQAR